MLHALSPFLAFPALCSFYTPISSCPVRANLRERTCTPLVWWGSPHCRLEAQALLGLRIIALDVVSRCRVRAPALCLVLVWQCDGLL